MSSQNKVYRTPLLYITQPRVDEVEAIMQSISSSKKSFQEKTSEVLDEEAKGEGEEKVVSSDPKDKRKKAFRDMSIEEKITYLISIPNQLPKLKCEVLTADDRHRGILQDMKDNVVIIKTYQRPYRIELLIEEIEDIKLTGF